MVNNGKEFLEFVLNDWHPDSRLGGMLNIVAPDMERSKRLIIEVLWKNWNCDEYDRDTSTITSIERDILINGTVEDLIREYKEIIVIMSRVALYILRHERTALLPPKPRDSLKGWSNGDKFTKAIQIDGIDGCYYVEDNELMHRCDDTDDVQVSDLTELKVWQYNQLVNRLLMHYPDYEIDKLEGKFI